MNLFFGFRGRIGRGMWWLCQAVCFMILLLTAFYLRGLGLSAGLTEAEKHAVVAANAGGILLTLAFGLGLSIWINLASTVKRFHDRDKHGVWFLISFVPFGWVWILVECGFLEGTLETNSYGRPGSATLPESASTGFDSEFLVRSYRLAHEQSHPAYDAASSPRVSGMGYAMKEEAHEVRKTRVPQPATGFGRRNGFR